MNRKTAGMWMVLAIAANGCLADDESQSADLDAFDDSRPAAATFRSAVAQCDSSYELALGEGEARSDATSRWSSCVAEAVDQVTPLIDGTLAMRASALAGQAEAMVAERRASADAACRLLSTDAESTLQCSANFERDLAALIDEYADLGLPVADMDRDGWSERYPGCWSAFLGDHASDYADAIVTLSDCVWSDLHRGIEQHDAMGKDAAHSVELLRGLSSGVCRLMGDDFRGVYSSHPDMQDDHRAAIAADCRLVSAVLIGDRILARWPGAQ